MPSRNILSIFLNTSLNRSFRLIGAIRRNEYVIQAVEDLATKRIILRISVLFLVLALVNRLKISHLKKIILGWCKATRIPLTAPTFIL